MVLQAVTPHSATLEGGTRVAESRAAYLIFVAAIACQACAITYYDAESWTHRLVDVESTQMRAGVQEDAP